MKLLNTYEDRLEAEGALKKINGERRLASERDATETIYNLFGDANWVNFYKLEMYNLPELKLLLSSRGKWSPQSQERHTEIINSLHQIAKRHRLQIPSHWL